MHCKACFNTWNEILKILPFDSCLYCKSFLIFIADIQRFTLKNKNYRKKKQLEKGKIVQLNADRFDKFGNDRMSE